MARLGVGTNSVLSYDVGRSFGFGAARAGGQAQKLSKVKIVLKKEAYNGMPYVILTSYPI